LLRRDLGQHLATGLQATHTPLGAVVHPPAVMVQSSSGTYVAAQDYCSDRIEFEATIVAPPGDLPAVADALDDIIDQVRARCGVRSTLGVTDGFKYQFVQVGGYTTFIAGDTELPAVVATVAVERQI
jgi:hypothetical protein